MSPDASKTESIRSSLIDPLLQRGERRVGAPEVALDRAQADAEFLGHLALRNLVDPMPPEDRRRPVAETGERFGHQPRLLAADQVALDRRGIGNAGGGPVACLAPLALAAHGLASRAIA